MRSVSSALSWMKNHKEGRSGMCLWTCQEAYGAPHVYPSAAVAWGHAAHKHRDDKPPRGAAVYWTGGSHGYGHIALSLGQDHIVSTDLPNWGRIGVVSLHTPRTSWGVKYAGWTPTIGGLMIPDVGSHAHSGKKDVFVHKLKFGQRHSDSVKALQVQLNKRLKLNASHHHLRVDGHYDSHTDYRVRQWQKKIGDKPDRQHRSSIGPRQARKMFGKKNYTLHK